MDYRISELEQRYVVLCYGMKLLAPTADNNNNPLRSRILNPLRSGTVTGDRDNNELIECKETERIGKKIGQRRTAGRQNHTQKYLPPTGNDDYYLPPTGAC